MRQKAADARFLECEFIGIGGTVHRFSRFHQRLDFFWGPTLRFILDRVLCKDNLFAKARNATALAIAPLAIRNGGSIQIKSLFVFATEIRFGNTRMNKIPGKYRFFFARLENPARVIMIVSPDLFPARIIKTLVVAFKNVTTLVGFINKLGKTAITAAQKGF